MKLTAFILLTACLTASANGYSQKVTLSEKDAPLEKVFKEIKRQTGFVFFYDEAWLQQAQKVTIQVRDFPLEDALGLCFKNQPLTFSIVGTTVVVKQNLAAIPGNENVTLLPPPPIDVKGRVVNEKGEPVEGASVQVKGNKTKGTSTDANGYFELKGIDGNAVLIISSVSIETFEVKVNGRNDLTTLDAKVKSSTLDETIVQAYGTTSRRLNTGNIGKVDSKTIEKQPISNPLAALEGRVPGLIVTQSNGVPGSVFKVEVRGKTSVGSTSISFPVSNDPFFIIDGVPFAPNNRIFNQFSSTASEYSGGLSPFSSLNPADIESIEVLKDADATAIYGSRGANGVILITTKKGKSGKTNFTMNVYTGTGKVTRTIDLLNTSQYVQMRREAFINDGVALTNTNAYDLLLYDTTKYTDWSKFLIGGTANITDAQSTISGGNANTQFLVGVGYHHETTVFPGDLSDGKASTHMSLNHTSTDRRFTFNFTGSYFYDRNNLLGGDLTSLIPSMLPNSPDLTDANGHLVWQYKGRTIIQPLANLLRTYKGETNNLLSNIQFSYQLFPGLTIKSSAGYNDVRFSEIYKQPGKSFNPASNVTGSSQHGSSTATSWIVEPQIEYKKAIGKGRINVLIGGTYQRNSSYSNVLFLSGYSSDDLLGSIASAGNIDYKSNSRAVYKYAALFSRINYNFKDKYILNLSARRDGSSRFGSDKQFANFGAVGAVWIFSNEKGIQKALPFLSFGKLRTSYGTTGNDKIGDYQYLNSWRATSIPYQSIPGLLPASLYNADYAWETTRKLEGALDLGFFKDRVLISASYYYNRSNNQLVSYSLPTQTGFGSIISNLPALVQNTGLELSLDSRVIQNKNFTWNTSFNISFPKNKLVSFPGIESSSYSYLVVGQPLSVYGGFKFMGVNPQTGIYQYADKNNNATSTPSYPDDYRKNLGNLEAKYYGGLNNSFTYKGFEFSMFFSFKKQFGATYLSRLIGALSPGRPRNQPTVVLNHWQKSGDVYGIQKYTQSLSSAAFNAASIMNTYGSDGLYGDASYIRLKNVALTYSLPSRWIQNLKMESVKLYIIGQNLFTITDYKGNDPETKEFYSLPPLRVISVGIKFTF